MYRERPLSLAHMPCMAGAFVCVQDYRENAGRDNAAWGLLGLSDTFEWFIIFFLYRRLLNVAASPLSPLLDLKKIAVRSNLPPTPFRFLPVLPCEVVTCYCEYKELALRTLQYFELSRSIRDSSKFSRGQTLCD
ncbi:hypothetical protein MTO96_032397 [Rhipicephalus appendiculatus]